ncbi:MAG TPA: hypothetical protein VFN74_21780 [Chloroflexota bacterium]|nr:hypothetical protein [Chloroflexota bacterium]
MTTRVWPKVGKGRRKELAKEMRERLAERQLGVGELADVLEIEPEEVVVVMRELRGKKRGKLVSGLHRGHTVWRWEETPKTEKPVKPKKMKKGKASSE